MTSSFHWARAFCRIAVTLVMAFALSAQQPAPPPAAEPSPVEAPPSESVKPTLPAPSAQPAAPAKAKPRPAAAKPKVRGKARGASPASTPDSAEASPDQLEEFPLPPELTPDQLPTPAGPLYEFNEAVLGIQRNAAPPPSQMEVVSAIIGFVVVLALAYIAGSDRFVEVSRRRGMNHFLVAGLPFVLLGMVASRPEVGVLSAPVLAEIRPLLPLGLGFVGFAIGSRFDARQIAFWTDGGGPVSILAALFPAGFIFGLAMLGQYLIDPSAVTTSLVRDYLILGAAGSVTALNVTAVMEVRGARPDAVAVVNRVLLYEQMAAIFSMMLIAVYFRPAGGVAWQIPGTGWLFVSLGIAAALGGLTFALLSRVPKGPSYLVMLLGSICFVAGMSSFLYLSTIAVSFFTGALLVNLPGDWKAQFQAVIDRLDRPVIFLFLTIAGALWHWNDVSGWWLLALFVPARLLGKRLGAWMLRRNGVWSFPLADQRCLNVPPIGALSIAMVVSAQDLYASPSVPPMVTAVIGGSLITELILHFHLRGAPEPEPEPGLTRPESSPAFPL